MLQILWRPGDPAHRPRYQLRDLLAEMPDEFPMVAGWDEMASVGKDVC